MKMKKVFLGFSILVGFAVAVVACKPKKANVPPEQDVDTQSAVNASYMNYVVSDIETMIAFMGENRYNDHFYAEYPGSSLPNGTGTVTAIRDTFGGSFKGWLRMSFNKTRCLDGRSRDGSIYLYYTVDSLDPNAKYMRSYKFQGTVAFSDFQVDSFKVGVNTDDGGYMIIKNTLPTATYSAKSTKLTWSIDGKLKFTHIYNPKKDMTWEGHWSKTLTNTSDPLVVKSPSTAINWKLGNVSYVGTVIGKVPTVSETGEITPMVPFSMKINSEYPLTRNFQCAPDPIGGVGMVSSTMTPVASEHHPFISGVTSFTIGDSYPREIYYGNEGQKAILPTVQCDNSGEVLIKGVSYRVDFMK